MESGVLIVGLGNPGPKYELTRHNVGFMVVDLLCDKHGFGMWQEKFNGLCSKINIAGNQLTLLKPQKFMNLSGRSVSQAVSFFKLEPAQVIVVYDDLDLAFGTVRIKKGGGTGGHKGIASCKQELGGSFEFTKVRIGIGRPPHGDVSNYVLSKFTADEMIDLEKIVKHSASAAVSIADVGIVKTMNQFNVRQGEEK